MMQLKEQIQSDLKNALRARNELEVSTLRMLLASLINKEKERGLEITDEEAQGILLTEVKKRKEAAEAFAKGGREEMAEKERKEMAILQQYLPEQLAEEEVRKLVKEAIEQTGAKIPQDMGKVMAVLMPRVRGKADGALVSALVKEFLA